MTKEEPNGQSGSELSTESIQMNPNGKMRVTVLRSQVRQGAVCSYCYRSPQCPLKQR